MSGSLVPARRDAPHRLWPPVVGVGPYGLLALLAIFTVVQKHSARNSPFGDLALCALTAAWMLWMVTLHPTWRDRPKMMALFVAGLTVVTAVLVIRDPWFGCFTPAGYLYAFRLLRWPWVLAGVAAVAAVAGTAQASDVDKGSLAGALALLAVVAANVVPMCGFAWVVRRSGQQSAQREAALAAAREANRRLAATLAENASLQEQVVAQARQAGVLDERQRMAREIHDTLAQGLTGIITQLQAAEHAEDDLAAWRRHCAAATALARESLSEARRSVHALRPEPLETGRLSEAIAGVARRWSALHELAVEVTTTGTARPLRPEVEVALLRTAQEALANVAKHARASRVGVTLSYLDHEVVLDVCDDGAGFDPAGFDPAGFDPAGCAAGPGATATTGGFGLVAMRQRIEGLAGTVRVESEPGGGTGVSACVPAAAAEEKT
ncbi:MAG TPA: sensor histidine kinase [Amycolatopsis sp.]|jgi:signal transduction histidine kinase|nr:sensor histidine kinase [Amycolatopsis sp.]